MTAATIGERAALTSMLALDADHIQQMEWQPIEECPGAAQKVLWSFGSHVQSLIRIDPEACLPGEPHYAAHHHIFVLSGDVTLNGRPLATGAYVHVPPQVTHRLCAGRTGCVLLHMYRPHAPQEAASVDRP
jgi:quercetin dioxygenase-like cupin family protein